MNQYSQSFQEFLAASTPPLSLTTFIVNLLIVAVLSSLLALFYIKFGFSLSNRKLFARNFLVIAMATMLVISIVKSSLALSLGLVGALSIIRFRTAIKEPEELAYLFINIALGLGLGAGQVKVTVAAFVIILGVVWLRGALFKKRDIQTLLFSVVMPQPQPDELNRIIEVLKRNCYAVNLKRFDSSGETLEALFNVDFDDYDKLQRSGLELQQLNKNVKYSFIDNSQI